MQKVTIFISSSYRYSLLDSIIQEPLLLFALRMTSHMHVEDQSPISLSTEQRQISCITISASDSFMYTHDSNIVKFYTFSLLTWKSAEDVSVKNVVTNMPTFVPQLLMRRYLFGILFLNIFIDYVHNFIVYDCS